MFGEKSTLNVEEDEEMREIFKSLDGRLAGMHGGGQMGKSDINSKDVIADSGGSFRNGRLVSNMLEAGPPIKSTDYADGDDALKNKYIATRMVVKANMSNQTGPSGLGPSLVRERNFGRVKMVGSSSTHLEDSPHVKAISDSMKKMNHSGNGFSFSSTGGGSYSSKIWREKVGKVHHKGMKVGGKNSSN